MLFDGTERKDCTLTDEEGKRLKAGGALDLAGALLALASPKIVPASARQIEASRSGALLDHRSDEHVASPKIFVATARGLGIIGIMQPQTAHDGHSGESGFAHKAVQVRHHAITQLQIFAANRFDLSVMQFAGIGKRRAVVAADLGRPRFAGVPTPGQAELPRAAMAAEKGAESAELEPAQIELRREFLRRDESADVRAPVRNAGEAGIDGDGYVDFQ